MAPLSHFLPPFFSFSAPHELYAVTLLSYATFPLHFSPLNSPYWQPPFFPTRSPTFFYFLCSLYKCMHWIQLSIKVEEGVVPLVPPFHQQTQHTQHAEHATRNAHNTQTHATRSSTQRHTPLSWVNNRLPMSYCILSIYRMAFLVKFWYSGCCSFLSVSLLQGISTFPLLSSLFFSFLSLLSSAIE